MSELWTPDEDRILIRSVLQEGLNYRETSERLPERSSSSVRHRWNRIKHGLNSNGEIQRDVPIENIPEVNLSAVVFDLETMSFQTDGYQDHLVCCSFLPLGVNAEDVYTFKLGFNERRNDKDLLIRVLEELANYDILIGHNIAAFDLNWLYSRAMYYGMVMPRSWIRYDTYQVAKSMAIKSATKSLAGLTAYFGLNSHKTSVQKADWSMVDSPIRAEYEHAMEQIVKHCEWDVIDNRELFYVLWKYDSKKRLKMTKW